jgi:glucose/arabinose dehydrogenase
MKKRLTMKTAVSIVVAVFLAGTGFVAFFIAKSQVYIAPRSSVDLTQPLAETGQDTAKKQEVPLALPGRFELSVYAKDLPGARVIIFDSAGTMLVSLTKEGKVVALPDKDGNGKAEGKKTVLDGLRKPHGLALRCDGPDQECQLYVAEENRVSVYDYAVEDASAKNGRKIIDLPAGGNHTTRTLLLAKVDGRDKLLISVGSTCNVCLEKDWRRAAVLMADLDGSNVQLFAKGLRNAVFMAIHPDTGKVWATEMGRDFLGDDQPPDEIDIIEQGRDYGWPICYGQNVHDAQFDRKRYIKDPCTEPDKLPSRIDLPAHSAPLGLAFFPESGWPEEYRHDALVALHGSWNRSEPTGYKLIRIKMDQDGKVQGVEDFLTGFLTADKKRLGRPADIVIRPNGLIYFSDDDRGAVFKLRYETAAETEQAPPKTP